MDSDTTPEEDKKAQLEMVELANKFIAMANQMGQKEKRASWIIGSALRYAAARYSAYESSMGSEDFLKDRDQLENWFGSQFKTMLIANMQQEVEALKGKQ